MRAVDLLKLAAVWLAQALALLLFTSFLPGLKVAGLVGALRATAFIALANALAWPVMVNLAARLHPALFPLVAFSLNALLVLLAVGAVGDLAVDELVTGAAVAVGLGVVQTLVGSALAVDDDGLYERYAIGPLRARYRGTPPTETPGVIFLEIDGLSEPLLREAMARGHAPTLRGWLDAGTHRLVGWESDLSSQTAASQAGILHGNNFGIPAFRWVEKQTGRLVVSNHPWAAADIQRSVSDGHGLLAVRGGSRGNLLSGDAPDSLFTFSTVTGSVGQGTRQYYLFYANPFTLSRTVALFLKDVAVEVYEGVRQVLVNQRPRVERAGVYPLVRAFTTSVLRELSTFTLAGDMLRGAPTAYSTYVAYDEVAHHSGIGRRDALRVLGAIDRDIGRLARVARTAPRPYHLVVLSDHGQSQGATFRQRTGLTLRELVDDLLAGKHAVAGVAHADEGWGTLNAVLTDVVHQDARAGRLVGRALERRTVGGAVALGPTRREPETAPSDVVVLGSGNLGLIYFTAWPHRLTLEEIDTAFPHLLRGLAAHPLIGFVLVRSAEHGPVALGAHGARYLDGDRVEGEDPLATFGPNAAEHLRREDSFPNAPDILVNSAVDPITGEVAAFEELVGSHGGLGGPQSRPFLLYPAELDPGPGPIVGPVQLHRVIKRWVPNDDG